MLRPESGQGTVEAAIAMPLFLLIVCAILQAFWFAASASDLDTSISAMEQDIASSAIAPGSEADAMKAAILDHSTFLAADNLEVANAAVTYAATKEERQLDASAFGDYRVTKATEATSRARITATITYRLANLFPGFPGTTVTRPIDDVRTSSYTFEVN